MISRRNIRIKVMQTLYTLESMQSNVKPGEPQILLKKHFDQSRQLFVYLAHFIAEMAQYAETDAHTKASKHLPTVADLNINTKIAGNEVIWKWLEDASYQLAMKEDKPKADRDIVKKFYQELVASPAYQQYISVEGRNSKSEKEIVQYIFSELLLPNELFTAHIEEMFTNWDDDCEMMNLLMLNYIQKPGSYNLQEIVSKEKMEFAKDLLRTVLEKREITLELIKPKLKNWDSERIATLDMIMMQMGVTEFLFFETIPPKVTINEYIDLAKEYSTPQSGQFVNGILDNIHKDLLNGNQLHKVSFKKG